MPILTRCLLLLLVAASGLVIGVSPGRGSGRGVAPAILLLPLPSSGLFDGLLEPLQLDHVVHRRGSVGPLGQLLVHHHASIVSEKNNHFHMLLFIEYKIRNK